MLFQTAAYHLKNAPSRKEAAYPQDTNLVKVPGNPLQKICEGFAAHDIAHEGIDLSWTNDYTILDAPKPLPYNPVGKINNGSKLHSKVK